MSPFQFTTDNTIDNLIVSKFEPVPQSIDYVPENENYSPQLKEDFNDVDYYHNQNINLLSQMVELPNVEVTEKDLPPKTDFAVESDYESLVNLYNTNHTFKTYTQYIKNNMLSYESAMKELDEKLSNFYYDMNSVANPRHSEMVKQRMDNISEAMLGLERFKDKL